MADQARVDMVAQRATQVACKHFGGDVVVHNVAVVAERARSLVVRCDVMPQPTIPRSLIVKQHTGDAARGFSDRASLAFLSTLDGARGVAPQFYGGDPEACLFVMEDLGGSRTLADVVAAGDVATIRGTLRALAEPMARLGAGLPRWPDNEIAYPRRASRAVRRFDVVTRQP